MGYPRTISTLLLCLSLSLAIIGAVNGVVNGGDPILNETLRILREAQGESTLQLKLAATAKALNIYQSGQYKNNLQGLIALNSSTSLESFNYILSTLRPSIVEDNTRVLFSLHTLMQIFLVIAWICISGWGTFRDYEDWTTDEKHSYVSSQMILIVAIFVSFIP